MYILNIEIEKENKTKYGEYRIKDKDLNTVFGFCERTGYKVIGIKRK